MGLLVADELDPPIIQSRLMDVSSECFWRQAERQLHPTFLLVNEPFKPSRALELQNPSTGHLTNDLWKNHFPDLPECRELTLKEKMEKKPVPFRHKLSDLTVRIMSQLR